MIEVPRILAREFRAVLRRSLLDREPRGTWPLLLCQTDRGGLTLQAVQGDIALRFRRPGPLPPEAIAFRSSALAEIEGKADEPVCLEAIDSGRGSARWNHAGEPRVLEFDTVMPDSVPAFPPLPKRLDPMPDGFLKALGEAAQTAGRDPVRFALHCVQLRGKTGTIVATDGHQLLVQAGFALPWPEDVLVPCLPVLGCRDFKPEGPAGIGRTKHHITLCVGPWTFVLAIDSKGRFPDVDTVIPKRAGVTSCLHLDPEDVALLAATLPKLPGREENNAPVTLDLGKQVVIRAKADEPGPATEVVLNLSIASGAPVLLNLDRRFLLRAAKLGFTDMEVVGPDKPVTFRDAERTYVVMLLEVGGAIAASTAMRHTSSTEDLPPEPPPPPERRNTPMPTPSTNGRPTDDPQTPDPRERSGGLNDLVAEAEALRALLGDASARTARLLAALRQHKRQAHALQAAMASLRKLKIDH